MSKTPVFGYCAAGCKRQVVAKEDLNFVTQAEYDELQANGTLKDDCLYVITDVADDLFTLVDELEKDVSGILNGGKSVQKAKQLEKLYINQIHFFLTCKTSSGTVYYVNFSVQYTDGYQATADAANVYYGLFVGGAKYSNPLCVCGSVKQAAEGSTPTIFTRIYSNSNEINVRTGDNYEINCGAIQDKEIVVSSFEIR